MRLSFATAIRWHSVLRKWLLLFYIISSNVAKTSTPPSTTYAAVASILHCVHFIPVDPLMLFQLLFYYDVHDHDDNVWNFYFVDSRAYCWLSFHIYFLHLLRLRWLANSTWIVSTECSGWFRTTHTHTNDTTQVSFNRQEIKNEILVFIFIFGRIFVSFFMSDAS